jgi:hypothetical protein
MNLIKTILTGILGLFVDDGSFAVLIVAWIAATCLLSFKVMQTPEWGTLLLFAGLSSSSCSEARLVAPEARNKWTEKN